MTLSVGELLSALPQEVREAPGPEESLRQLLADISKKPVPLGVLNRMWFAGTLQAKIALAYLAYWVRSAFADGDSNARRLNETHLNAALKLLCGMSYLRGAMMKVGQMLANYPHVMPDEFIDTLSRLHFDAPPMHYALLREHLAQELGRDPEEAFAEFETAAFAAASLGQVHRARLKTGERVAVKVQYPNIARTIRDDFRALSTLMWPMRLRRDWETVKAQIEDVRRTLERETDYENEAALQRKAGAAFHDEDGIVVPAVHDAYSTRRVLTMDYVEGRHLPEFLASDPSQEQRDHFGTLIMRTSFRLFYGRRICYADPHPGNYFFLRDGRLGLIDFGCCRELDDGEWSLSNGIFQGYVEGGEAERKGLMRSAGVTEGQPIPEEHLRLMHEVSDWINSPLFVDGPFDFGDEAYIRRGFELLAEFPKRGYVRGVPVTTWLLRGMVGLRAICYRLRARVNMKRIFDQEAQPSRR
jgi:predicted unusual protein kinase regulating ubiquinone biosynthesis (AarF/ABC1/UbiB family)